MIIGVLNEAVFQSLNLWDIVKFGFSILEETFSFLKTEQKTLEDNQMKDVRAL